MGCRTVQTTLETCDKKNIELTNQLNIGKKVTKPVCSMGKAYRQGFKTVTDPGGDSYFEKDGIRVPLLLRKN
eukprot:7278809-Heterocapsa_arctica.AAC.1